MLTIIKMFLMIYVVYDGSIDRKIYYRKMRFSIRTNKTLLLYFEALILIIVVWIMSVQMEKSLNMNNEFAFL